MLDTLAVLFSTMAVLFVAWHAAKLDELYPWFDHVPDPEGDAGPSNDARRTAEALRGERQFR